MPFLIANKFTESLRHFSHAHPFAKPPEVMWSLFCNCLSPPRQLHISHECLAVIYSTCLNEASVVKSTLEKGDNNRRKSGRGFDFLACSDWWTGKSELSKKLLLKQILEKDVGLNATPPSFDRGRQAYERRRERIEAAKLRIQKTMSSSDGDSGIRDLSFSKSSNGGKRKRKLQVDIDREDFIIETNLLHQVKEEEIEKRHYKALLDLHVFNNDNEKLS